MGQTCADIIAAGCRNARELCCGLGFVLALLGTGCSTVPPASPGPAPARLEVKNVTDYAWRLTITPVAGGQAREEWVPPRTEHLVGLAGGEYEIEQAVVKAGLVRRIICRLENGKSYRWQLATLLSTDRELVP